MAGMAAGRGIGGRTRHPVDGCADGAAWLAPGHSISTRATREKLATLDALSMQGVLSKAKDAQMAFRNTRMRLPTNTRVMARPSAGTSRPRNEKTGASPTCCS